MYIIYLAAGISTRMGLKKQSLPLRGGTLGNYALHTLMSVPDHYIFVIVNKEDDLNWISKPNKKKLQGIKGEILIAEQASEGQSYSIKKGIKRVMEESGEKVIICLADQPFITVEMINTLKTEEIDIHTDYIASSNKGVIKPPILFTNTAFPSLLLLEGDVGARKIIANNKLQGKKIEFSNDTLFIDIDTFRDYELITTGVKKGRWKR